eukprot:jgi/Hompol1/6358/HPOL_002108-RA
MASATDVFGHEDEHSAVIEQLVNNVMRDGKKAVARSIVQEAMAVIQLKTRRDPRAYVAEAIERAAPFVKVASVKRAGRNVPTPRPLTARARARTAILWIRDAAIASKFRGVSAGTRLGNELIAVVEGRSSALLKREQVHKVALANRSNVVMSDRRIK